MDTTFETQMLSGRWASASVTERPELVLTDWAVYELQLPGSPGRTRYFAGYNIAEREGLVSIAIAQFDPTNWRGVTHSGLVYGLRGRPGLTPDGEFVWRHWISISGATEVVDVTNELLALMSHK
jgi:hypothetical protein